VIMSETTERQQMLADAFHHLQSAIELLDRADAPGNIAANLDLALHQLQAELWRLQQTASQQGASDQDSEAAWTFSKRQIH
jgi:hypothetical protein